MVVSDDDITDYSASEDESIPQIEPSTTLTQVGSSNNPVDCKGTQQLQC